MRASRRQTEKARPSDPKILCACDSVENGDGIKKATLAQSGAHQLVKSGCCTHARARGTAPKHGRSKENEQRRTPVFWQKAQAGKRLHQGTFQPVAQRVPAPPVFFYFPAMSGGFKPRAETFHWQNFLFLAESFRPNKTSESLRMSYTKIDLARRSSEDTPLLLLTPLHP